MPPYQSSLLAIITVIITVIRTVSAEHYLGLRDRLQLWRDTLATVAKLGYAFLWQVMTMMSIIMSIIIIFIIAWFISIIIPK